MLITFDMGFADIRAYPPEAAPGLIVLRLAARRPSASAASTAPDLATRLTACVLLRMTHSRRLQVQGQEGP